MQVRVVPTVVLLVQDLDNVIFIERELGAVGAFVPGEALVENETACYREGGREDVFELQSIWT